MPAQRPASRLGPERRHDAAEQRRRIDELLGQGNDSDAWWEMRQLWQLHAGPSTAAYVSKRVEQCTRAVTAATARVVILRSFTVEPLVPMLRAAAMLADVRVDVQLGDFNTYVQEILDERSPLYHGWEPDITILAVQTQDIAPELWEGFAELSADAVSESCDRVVTTLEGMIRSFRERTDAHLVVHSFEVPPFLALGIADGAATPSQVQAIRSINARLADVARSTPGVHVLDYDELVARVGRQRWRDDDKWAAARMPLQGEAMVALVHEWMRFVQPIAGRVAKVLAVDLDNTLWGGVIGEDGIDGIDLGDRRPGAGHRVLQRTLLDLKARGILLAICSKNNEAEALEAIDRHPRMLLRTSDFSSVQINWRSKADNLRAIAAELNIGVDAVAFLDDNLAECLLVHQQLPEVPVIHLSRLPDSGWHPLAQHPLFERTGLTADDRGRAEQYAQRRDREAGRAASGSLEAYLHSLETRVWIRRATAQDVPRLAQLTQKTNQFNLTTIRMSEPAIEAIRVDPARGVYAMNAADRFGDHGLIGLATTRLEGGRLIIENLLLSCRVIGRSVEVALLARVVADAVAGGATAIEGAFTTTAKNVPAQEFYAENGFIRVDHDGVSSTWRLDADVEKIAVPSWISIDEREG